MPFKIVKINARFARVVYVAAAVFCLLLGYYFVKWNFANIIASRIEAGSAESRLVAEWLAGFAPSDPQTHFAAGRIFEQTLDPGDLTRSLHEYEWAAALSPNSYAMWLAVGRSRSLNGDTTGAETAYARALALAPNNAAVQWTYGNALIRHGKTDEGFAMIARASGANPDYAAPAVATALQIFDGDQNLARKALGDAQAINAALASSLAEQKRFEEAVEAWSKLDAAGKTGKFKTLGDKLVIQFAAAKEFRLASGVSADLQTDGEKPSIGEITNGGFENGVKMRDAGMFEWRIAEGAEPRIGIGEGQSHGGKYTLLLSFNTFETGAFREISQTVAVAPGASYEFEAFYKSDLKTQASLKWEVLDAATSALISSTPPMVPAAGWTALKTKFTAPSNTDGVIIRLAREGCGGPTCPVNGKISFDDFSLRRL